MQDKNARFYGSNPSPHREATLSAPSAKRWRAGFVKPDGTRIELFAPERSALRPGFNIRRVSSSLISFFRAFHRRLQRPQLPVTRKATHA